jgi:hypothetical protein
MMPELKGMMGDYMMLEFNGQKMRNLLKAEFKEKKKDTEDVGYCPLSPIYQITRLRVPENSKIHSHRLRF